MQVSSLFAVLASLASTLVLAAPASLVTREDAGIALIVGPQYRIDSGKAQVSGSKESVGDSYDRWWGPDVLGHVSRTIHIGGLGELFDPASGPEGARIANQMFQYTEKFEADGVKVKAEPYWIECSILPPREPKSGGIPRSVQFTLPSSEEIKKAGAGEGPNTKYRVKDKGVQLSCERSTQLNRPA